jgi:hypothetical protein
LWHFLFYTDGGYVLLHDKIDEETGAIILQKGGWVFYNIKWLYDPPNNVIAPRLRYFYSNKIRIYETDVQLRYKPHFPHFLLVAITVFFTIYNILTHL